MRRLFGELCGVLLRGTWLRAPLPWLLRSIIGCEVGCAMGPRSKLALGSGHVGLRMRSGRGAIGLGGQALCVRHRRKPPSLGDSEVAHYRGHVARARARSDPPFAHHTRRRAPTGERGRVGLACRHRLASIAQCIVVVLAVKTLCVSTCIVP